jgi:hypothetical protein
MESFYSARDKLAGTDWSIVSTSDGKKYYYDNKQKVRSRPWLGATLVYSTFAFLRWDPHVGY